MAEGSANLPCARPRVSRQGGTPNDGTRDHEHGGKRPADRLVYPLEIGYRQWPEFHPDAKDAMGKRGRARQEGGGEQDLRPCFTAQWRILAGGYSCYDGMPFQVSLGTEKSADDLTGPWEAARRTSMLNVLPLRHPRAGG